MREILILDVTEHKMFLDDCDRNIEILKKMRPKASELRHFGYPDEAVTVMAEKFIVPVERYTERFKTQFGFYHEDQTFFAVNPTQNKLLTVWFQNYSDRFNQMEGQLIAGAEQNGRLFKEISDLKERIHNVERASFWQRLKWLFTGVEI